MITNPSHNWLYLTANIGLTVHWSGVNTVRVTVAGKYREKMCGLCGNFNGDGSDDAFNANPQCVQAPSSAVCAAEAAAKNREYMDLCNHMKSAASPFGACNAAVDPGQFVKNCRYDACQCENPMQCVCKSFAAYSRQCSNNAKVLKWRFRGTYLFPPLGKCGMV